MSVAQSAPRPTGIPTHALPITTIYSTTASLLLVLLLPLPIQESPPTSTLKDKSEYLTPSAILNEYGRVAGASWFYFFLFIWKSKGESVLVKAETARRSCSLLSSVYFLYELQQQHREYLLFWRGQAMVNRRDKRVYVTRTSRFSNPNSFSHPRRRPVAYSILLDCVFIRQVTKKNWAVANLLEINFNYSTGFFYV